MPNTFLTETSLVRAGVEPSKATLLCQEVADGLATLTPASCWQRISRELLDPTIPFEAHEQIYETVFQDWSDASGPPPAWTPTNLEVSASNVGQLMRDLGYESYAALYDWSIQAPDAFWDTVIHRLGIQFRKRYERVVDLSQGLEQPIWLPGAQMNIAESCFTAPADSPAIVSQSEEGSEPRSISYAELDAWSNRVAHGLTNAGFRPGDAVAVFMPMHAASVAIYLGIVKCGCIVVSVADSFAAAEIHKRVHLAKAKAVFTQDFMVRGGKRIALLDRVVEAGVPQAIVLPGDEGSKPEGLRPGDTAWASFLGDDRPFDACPREPHAAINLLFSSGTTGEPKVIPWNHTTPMKCAMDGWAHHDIRRGDVVAWPTNLGWMMGPWLIFAGLINRGCIALYDGAPTSRGFTQFVQDAGVTMLGVVPSLVKTWRAQKTTMGLDWSRIRCFSSTGECSNAEDYLWLMSTARYKPVVEYCGGTEIGGGYMTGSVALPASPASFSSPALGLAFEVLDEHGRPSKQGEVFLVPPSIGLSTELMGQDHQVVYFEGTPKTADGKPLRRHGDEIECLGNGFYRAHGRTDDTMNLGGIKVSSAELERIAAQVPDVHEAAAVAVQPQGGGPAQLVFFVVSEENTELDANRAKHDIQQAIRAGLNPLFRVHDLKVVEALPRTASNKVMRRTLRTQYLQ